MKPAAQTSPQYIKGYQRGFAAKHHRCAAFAHCFRPSVPAAGWDRKWPLRLFIWSFKDRENKEGTQQCLKMFRDEDPQKKEVAWSWWSKQSHSCFCVTYLFLQDNFHVHHSKSHPRNWILGIDWKHIQILPFLGEILFHLHLKGQILSEDTKSLVGEVQDTHNSEHVHNFDGLGVLSFFLEGAPQFHSRTVESLEHSPRLFLPFTFQLRYLPQSTEML